MKKRKTVELEIEVGAEPEKGVEIEVALQEKEMEGLLVDTNPDTPWIAELPSEKMDASTVESEEFTVASIPLVCVKRGNGGGHVWIHSFSETSNTLPHCKYCGVPPYIRS